MIFVTVGAQMPFDRMIRAVDAWCGRRKDVDVFAQIGRTSLVPKNFRWVEFLNPPRFRECFQAASAIVAHAGMGSIITALQLGKPILVMPRRGDLGETRNDHQVATAAHFHELGYVSVAFDEEQMLRRLDQLDRLGTGPLIGPRASPFLLAAIRNFINRTATAPVRPAQAQKRPRPVIEPEPTVSPFHRVG